MNREEILNMFPSREMDALIGKEIMGLELWYGDPTGFDIDDNINYYQTDYKDVDGEYYVHCPYYSTIIGHTWDIINESIDFNLSMFFDNINMWECGIRFPNGDDTIWATGETPELAICRAALLAKLEEEDYEQK